MGQLFNHAIRRFGEKAVENGVPAGVRVGANLAHIPTVPAAGNRKLLGIGDAAPIAIHLPFHKPDDFIGEFQTAAGEIVTWINVDGLPHDVVFTKVPDGVNKDDIDHSETIDRDDFFSSTFATPGVYIYHSDNDSNMSGKVVVKA